MKTYFETAINPKTKKKEKIEVFEYSFEDWEQGRISGNWVGGKKLVYNNTEQKHHFDFLPFEEYEKIDVARKKLYWEKVANQLIANKTVFNLTYEKSGNKKRLFEIEIDNAEKTLSNSPLYEQLIVRGNREYYYTNSPNSQISIGIGDYHHIKTEALSQFYEWLKDKSNQLNNSMGINFYDNDPKKGGNQISYYEYLKISGLIEGFSESGMVINPTHDFELLKTKRSELFIKAQKDFIAERNLNRLTTTDFEVSCLYIMWLNNELNVIESWLSDKYPNGKKKDIKHSNSDQIEIMKYNHYVNNEIARTEKKLNEATAIIKENTVSDNTPTNYLNIAKRLIEQRIELQKLVTSIETQLNEKKKSIEHQQNLAIKGLNNILAFEKAGKAKIELELIKVQKSFDEINIEIETQKLAAELKNVNELKDNHSTLEPRDKTVNSKEEKRKPPQQNDLLKLFDFITDISKYDYVMNLLVKKGHCQAITFVWKDEANGNKSLLAAILKHLHKQGYYKNNKRPTNEQMVDISNNTFGWKISIDTIKRAKPEQFDLSFIPTFPTAS